MDEGFKALEQEVTAVAKRLLGCVLEREVDGHILRARIVETEAYHQTDAASHRGKTPRTEVMFGPAGHLYVYFTYGMHYCMNVVTGGVGEGSAVLIRALEPLQGMELMREARHGLPDVQLTNGPAKLCQAYGVDTTMNGHDLRQMPLRLVFTPLVSEEEVVTATRIGITRDADRPWRSYIKGNPYVSKNAKTG